MVIHWTDEEGLEGILDSMCVQAESHFTLSEELTFDIDNNCSFGLLFKEKDLRGLGYKNLPKNTVGVTREELIWELEGGGVVSLDFLVGFFVRTETHKVQLSKILDFYGLRYKIRRSNE